MARRPLKIEQILPGEWRFVYRAKEAKFVPQIMEAMFLLQYGEIGQAEEIVRNIIEVYPLHLDARHILAGILLNRKERSAALATWREATSLGRSAFPKNFQPGKDKLEWVWPENRPFLRATAGLGLVLYQMGNLKEAADTFRDLLSFDPKDHQGVRGMAIEIAFALGNLEEITRICSQYTQDYLVDTIYARPLAHIMAGNQAEAEEYLQKAITEYPRVARELTKKRHPKPRGFNANYLEVGGADEAYNYWRRMGKYWKKTPGALEMIKGKLVG